MLYLSQFWYLLTLIFVLGIQANGVLDVSCSDQQFKCQWNGLSTCLDVETNVMGSSVAMTWLTNLLQVVAIVLQGTCLGVIRMALICA